MRKLSLTVIGLYVGILAAFSQNTSDSSYKSKKLGLDEINFVSGYYQQNGDHSAVTGGIGTEHLTDLANTIELKLFRYDAKLRKHSLTLELGVDHYSSASSDKIDPSTISSASHADTRVYPSIGWNIQNETRGTTVGLTTSFSNEFDYTSFGMAGSFSKTSKNNNREFNVKAQVYLDRWKVIYPIELRPAGDDHGPSMPRNSFSTLLSFSQVINPLWQLSLVAEPSFQKGLLATKYQRVYFSDGGVKAETLPDMRLKLPLALRSSYFIGDRFILRTFYRYYMDDWGIKAHTIDLETPVKITPSFSVAPFYRYYVQTATRYFAPYALHKTSDSFFTSDFDLSEFNSHFFGAGFRLVPPNGVFGIQRISSLEIRGGHYQRTDGLSSNTVSLHLTFK